MHLDPELSQLLAPPPSSQQRYGAVHTGLGRGCFPSPQPAPPAPRPQRYGGDSCRCRYGFACPTHREPPPRDAYGAAGWSDETVKPSSTFVSAFVIGAGVATGVAVVGVALGVVGRALR